MSIINVTKHPLRFYPKKFVQPDRANPTKFYLTNPEAPYTEIERFGTPANVHYFGTQDNGLIIDDGVSIHGNLTYFTSIDTLPYIDLSNDILVVSSFYGEILKNQLSNNAPLLDCVFTEASVVLSDGQVVGTTALRKLGPFYSPSYYYRCSGNKHSRALAIDFWRSNRHLLSNPYELRCLELLLESSYSHEENY